MQERVLGLILVEALDQRVDVAAGGQYLQRPVRPRDDERRVRALVAGRRRAGDTGHRPHRMSVAELIPCVGRLPGLIGGFAV